LIADYRQAINTHIPPGAGNIWGIDYDVRKLAIHTTGIGNTANFDNGRGCVLLEPQAANFTQLGKR
jgi:hypothetical protein